MVLRRTSTTVFRAGAVFGWLAAILIRTGRAGSQGAVACNDLCIRLNDAIDQIFFAALGIAAQAEAASDFLKFRQFLFLQFVDVHRYQTGD